MPDPRAVPEDEVRERLLLELENSARTLLPLLSRAAPGGETRKEG